MLHCPAMARLWAVAVAVTAAAGAYQVFMSSGDSSGRSVPGFDVIGPGARRRSTQWKPMPFVQVPVATFLLEVSGEAGGHAASVLVDAGVPDKAAIAQLVQQLRAATSAAPLRMLIGNAVTCFNVVCFNVVLQSTSSAARLGGLSLLYVYLQQIAITRKTLPLGCDKRAGVAVTHGHPDHLGALAQLQEQFPEMSIVLHSAEAPFVVGPAAQQAKYSAVPSDNTAYKVLLGLLGPLTPRIEADEERTFLLSGPALPWLCCSAQGDAVASLLALTESESAARRVRGYSRCAGKHPWAAAGLAAAQGCPELPARSWPCPWPGGLAHAANPSCPLALPVCAAVSVGTGNKRIARFWRIKADITEGVGGPRGLLRRWCHCTWLLKPSLNAPCMP